MVKEKGRSKRYRGSSEIQQSNFSEYSGFVGFNSGYFKRGNSLFINTLTEAAFRTLKKVAQLPQIPEFYLAGGSAAALYLGHRVSIDLVFFTERQSYQSEPLIQSIQGVGNLYLQQQSQGTLVGLLDEVQISFFTYPYGLLGITENLEGIRIASLLDISLMKIIAISQRGKMRDFIDLYFLCQEKFTLGDLLNFIPRKYPAINYPSYHLLRSLVYFSDAEDDAPPRSITEWDWNEIKEFFNNEVKIIMQQMA